MIIFCTFRNIYLSGGASLLPGFAERIETELAQLVASTIQVQVHISPWRYHAAYLGAQVVAGSAQFGNMLATESNLGKYLLELQKFAL